MTKNEKPIRLSAKESVILELLYDNQERYGLELVRMSEGELKRGTIYVTLNRMEEKLYISSRHEVKPIEIANTRSTLMMFQMKSVSKAHIQLSS